MVGFFCSVEIGRQDWLEEREFLFYVLYIFKKTKLRKAFLRK